MEKRHFLRGLAALIAAPSAVAAEAQLGGQLRRAYVRQPQLIRQSCPMWCWAASIAMIFAAHGFRVRQERIVEETFGARVCAPSGPTINIARALTRVWEDDRGGRFRSKISAAYDVFFGVNSLDNEFMIDELSNDKPLLVCNRSHAMVLVSVDYIDSPTGVRVHRVGVLDPYPATSGYRLLSPSEATVVQQGGEMTFLAAVDVF